MQITRTGTVYINPMGEISLCNFDVDCVSKEDFNKLNYLQCIKKWVDECFDAMEVQTMQEQPYHANPQGNGGQ